MGTLFKLVRFCLNVCKKPLTLRCAQSLPACACFIVHHQNLRGPVQVMRSMPVPPRPWVLHVFFSRAECYRQYAGFTFSQRLGWPRVLANAVSVPLSVFVSALIRSCRSIPVHRDIAHLRDTFRDSLDVLMRGESVLIAPDIDYGNDSPMMGEMYEGFLQLGPMYRRRAGAALPFVPLYCSPARGELLAGEPVYLRDDVPFSEDRTRVARELIDAINAMARACGDIPEASAVHTAH